MAQHYTLRVQPRKNYRMLSDTPLPRAQTAKCQNKLYELEIVDEDESSGKVKVHYTGYGSEDDEWRDREDIVMIKPLKLGKYTDNSCKYISYCC